MISVFIVILAFFAYPLFYMAQDRAENAKDIRHHTLTNALVVGVILIVINCAMSRDIITSIIYIGLQALLWTFVARRLLYKKLAAKQSANHNLNLFKEKESENPPIEETSVENNEEHTNV